MGLNGGYCKDLCYGNVMRSVLADMDTCCVAVKSTAHLGRVSKGGFNNGEKEFFGEQIRGSLKNNLKFNQSSKSLKLEKKENKIKPGVAFSVITTENEQETLFLEETAPRFERRRANPKDVASVILGGGEGAKLFPLTSRAATPAVPVGGCYKLIDIPMSNCINSGINKVFVLTQYNSAPLNRHIARTYFGNGVSFGDGFVEVLAATQTPGETGKRWFQGTADAVRQFIWVFEDAKNKNIENILILSGDHLYRMDYMELVQNHIDRNSDITLSCALAGDSRASDFGLVKIDSRGRVVQFAEKPKGFDLKAMQVDTTLLGLSPQDAKKSPYIASMGVYVFKTDVLLKLLKWRYPTANDFGSEIIPAAIDEQNVQIKDAIISHGCFLRECTVEHSIVGERSRIDSGVELKDTLMMGADYYQTESEIASLLAEGKVPIGIGENTKIRNCIIDKNAKIGKDVVIMNKDDVQAADRPEEGFYIRSGLTIIAEKATIKDGTVI
ncbi:Glucose-1-phosphate adenylyltransferase large subunit, chloroplastic/amyloplastic [Capsicum baccatum]|uniref:Glucose-1-phosphate adenylyltransferase large subunit, chloroplastic/amyloplastic n=1 Tax=Capsicum baccatum TaxID=33114 RepID=A0A2G2XNM5_CAPBA|nr:Glucose-1-phosphate adenylyltransferase large subunit, chloroplastic/amyloplastic [Capsicum baccatum]